MPSAALRAWSSSRARALDRVVRAHAAARREGGREVARQVLHAYTVLLASHFQGFCRDLHDEASEAISEAVPAGDLRRLIREQFAAARQLDTGNARPGAVGADFGRFFFTKFWDDIDSLHPRLARDRTRLDSLHAWRNAIAHQDFKRLAGSRLRLADVRRWRSACDRLARAFDRLLAAKLHSLVSRRPW